MISVALLLTEHGRLTIEAGGLDFFAVPVQRPADYQCIPGGIVSPEDAQFISAQLARGAVSGQLGRYEWRKVS